MTQLAQTSIDFDIKEHPVTAYETSGAGMDQLISNLIGLATAAAGIALLGYFIYGAIMWITAQGNEERVERAQKTISNALIGLVIVILATSIVAIVGAVTGVEILSPPWESLGPASGPTPT